MIRTLVFPSCNEPGLEIIQALEKSNKIEVWGGSSIDGEYDPSKIKLKNHVVVPYLGDQNFEEVFRNLLISNAIDVVFPSADSLIAEFANWDTPKTTFIVPNAKTATMLLSKTRTYKTLNGVVPVPHIFGEGEPVTYPVYAKPDQGAGSKGHMLVTNDLELRNARQKTQLITEFLPGDEFTVDCLNDLDGNNLFYNIRERGLIGRGISLGTRGASCDHIGKSIQRICETIQLEGPWFAQFKLCQEGIPKLLEINSRIGGSSALTEQL